MPLQDKVALVTGGGTGIGRATSLMLAREGAAVAVNYSRSQAEAEETVADIIAEGGRAIAVKADIASDEQVRTMVQGVSEEWGRLDILVNNAGATTFVEFQDLDGLTEELWDQVYDVNVKGTFWVCRAAAPLLRQTGKGAIVNLSSIAGLCGRGSSIAYCASKAAVISLTKSLALTLAPEITVNSVAPGFIDTRWTAGWDEYREINAKNTPLKRVGAPEDSAEVVVGLCTNASFVTGQTIVVDGGRTI